MAVSDFEFNKLKSEVEELRKLVQSMGGGAIPDPLEIQKIILGDRLVIGPVTSPVIEFYSNTGIGGSAFINTYNTLGPNYNTMTISGLEKLYVEGLHGQKQIYP